MARGPGYDAGRTGFFSPQATAFLTKFVFCFALSAILFRFSANLPPAALPGRNFMLAYLCGTICGLLLATFVAYLRGRAMAAAAFKAQCAAIGTIGFLGIPMLALRPGDRAVEYITLMLAIGLIVFSSLIVVLVTGSRDG